MAASSGFTKRFQMLAYDHPWHTYPYIIGMMFTVISILDRSAYMLLGWDVDSFLERMAFSAMLAGIVQYKFRSREARDRNRAIRGSEL